MRIGMTSAFEPHHTKPVLLIFVIVIPKEALAGLVPVKPSFGMTI